MHKLIMLMIACSVLSVASYSQDCDTTLKGVNLALNAGYNCCQQLDVCDSTVKEKNGVIRDLQKQLIYTEYKYGLKHGNFITADSAYKVAALHLNECTYEVQRLKKGKRNWQILTILTGAALAGFIIIK